MNNTIHVDELKRSVNLVEFLEDKGILLKRNGKSFVGLCPLHKDTKPSFTVDPGKNLWHCFGCNKGGDIFTFLQELEGVTFAQALELLQPYNSEPLKPREHPTPQRPGKTVNTQELLNRVVEYYHQTFYEDTRGLVYLRDKRNLHDRELYDTFKIGFANGSLFKMLPESGDVLDALKTLGIITARGTEFFHTCVIFPIYNEDGQVTEIYGRAIEDRESPHLYLKGPHKGVFNWQAAKRSTELLLTEGVIDALSLYQAGFRDVIPLYGVNGLSQDHLSLFRKYATKKLFFVFDNDPPGHEACISVARNVPPVQCLTITLPVKDANDFFRTRTADDFVPLLAQAEPVQVNDADSVEKERGDDFFILRFGSLSYIVKRIPSFDEKLRVTIKAVYGDKIFLDTLDLYSHKSRQVAINQVSKKFELSKEKVERHFVHIIEETERFENEKASPCDEKGGRRPG